MAGNAAAPHPSPMASQIGALSQTSYGQQFSPSRPPASPAPGSMQQHSMSYGSHGPASHAALPQTPVYQSQQGYSQHAASVTTPVAQHHHASAPFNTQYHSTAPVPRVLPQSVTPHVTHGNVYNPPRQSEVYTLPEMANSAIPADVRNQFHTDNYGKVLFFTTPPLNINPIPQRMQGLGHSLRYLADKARNKEADEKKRKARAARLEEEEKERVKRVKSEEAALAQFVLDQSAQMLRKVTENMDKETDELYKQMHGENWEEMRKEDLAKVVARQEAALEEKKSLEAFKEEQKKRDEAKNIGFKWI